jgi:hypothetical protein
LVGVGLVGFGLVLRLVVVGVILKGVGRRGVGSVVERKLDMSFDRGELYTIEGALRVALDEYRKTANELSAVADELRAGSSVPPFADGEGGALAAWRLSEQFAQQVLECENLLEVVFDGDVIR